MATRRVRRRSSQLALPWEREGNALRALVSGRRLFPLLAMLALGLLLWGAFWVGGRQADLRATRATLAQVREATHAFVLAVGRCPHNARELVHPPRSGVHYLVEPPVDAWGRAIYFRCSDGERPEIEVMSAGPSGSLLEADNVL